MIKEYTDFLTPYFKNKNQAEKFVKKCENVSAKKQNAKLMLHQMQRIVTLADDIYKIRRRDSLRLLFLIICAEAVAKLHANYTQDGKSREYVHKFFCSFCDLKLLDTIFENMKSGQPQAYLNRWDTVDVLYDIRCSVVHEGRYWDFHFQNTLSIDPTIVRIYAYSKPPKKQGFIRTQITYDKFRDIIVRGTIKAIQDYLQNKPYDRPTHSL